MVEIESNRAYNSVLRIARGILSHLPGGRRAKTPRNILVLRLGNVGDIIVALPAFHALRRLYPDARMTFLTSPTRRGAPGAQEVLVNDSTFDEIIVYYKDESGKRHFIWNLYRKIRALDIDLAVELPNQLTSFKHLMKYLVLLAATGVRRFEGFQRVAPADYEMRQVDRLVNIIAQIGPAEVEPFPWMRSTEADEARVRSLLAPSQGRRLVGMHCGAKRQANRWAPESFIEVGKQLVAEQNVSIVLTGSPTETELTAKVVAGIGSHCVDLGGKTDLSLLTAVARQCAIFISNDTGVMHVAYAAGTPTVAVFSARFYPTIWYPYGDRQVVLRHTVDCELCGHDICPLYDYPKCLALVTPEEVVQAAARMLGLAEARQAQNG